MRLLNFLAQRTKNKPIKTFFAVASHFVSLFKGQQVLGENGNIPAFKETVMTDNLEDGWDGGPAFPREHLSDLGHNGMSLRDWFAGQALAVVVADLGQERNDDVLAPSEVPRLAAKGAYLFADAMLAARGRP